MTIQDVNRAARKISQVGYYRLSGFWYPCRQFQFDANKQVVREHGVIKRSNEFLADTDFDEVFKLYTFDKRLRLLLLDGIERIEINLKTVLAHELGKDDPLAYQRQKFINPTQLQDYCKGNQIRNAWTEWGSRQRSELSRSKEDSILWHKKSKSEIPIWVAVESWSLGTLSKYFELLKGSYQNRIASRLEVNNATILVQWLQSLTILRNRCAHHTRVWNQSQNNPINIPEGDTADAVYFSNFNLTTESRKKIYSLIVVIWYLVQKIGPNSDWIQHICEELQNFPNLPFEQNASMGLPDDGVSIDPFLMPNI